MYGCDIQFGDSYFYHDDQIIAFIMHQFIYFGIVVIENSTYFVGETIFSNMLGPVMDKYLNHYKYDFSFPSLVRGQDTFDYFQLDFRNVRDPALVENRADFFILGEILYNGNGCDLNPGNELPFLENQGDLADSQLVISESAASCIANQVAASRIGHIHMDRDKFNKFWGTGNKLDFTTTSFAGHLPLFQDKIGPNVNITADFNFKDINVQLGRGDSDLTVDYTMGLLVSTHKNGTIEEKVFYDEVKMTTTATVRAEDDIVFI